MTSEKERRAAPRVRLRRLAKATPRGVKDAYPCHIVGTTADLSEGGLRFEAKEDLDLGAEVVVSFVLGRHVIEVAGQVVHHAPLHAGEAASMGIRFTNLSEEDRRLISGYCREKGARTPA